MILGWVRDHRCAMMVVALVATLGLHAHEVVLGNPLGSSLVSIDSSAFVVFLTAASATNALRSRVSRELLVRSAWWTRLLWLSVLTVLMVAVLVAADPRTGELPLACNLATLLWLPLALCAVGGEAAGLITVFGLFAAHLVSPRLGPAPWWSPLLHRGTSALDLTVAALFLAAVGWCYVANAGGRRNS